MSARDGSSDDMRLRSLTRGLRDRNIAILHQGPDDRYDLAENLPGAWPDGGIIGRSDAEALPAELAAVLAAAKSEVERRGRPALVEAELVDGGGITRLFEIEVTPDSDDSNDSGFILVVSDITEMRERELALTSLMREVSHRSKNLLAIVQAIAMQTASHSDTTADFLVRFRGRLLALAGTQDLVTESNWRGTRLRQLAKTQFARLGAPALDAVSVDGIDPLLGPNAALHIGLAIHELATNALLHGALAGGRQDGIHLTTILLPPPDDALVLEWREPRSSERDANAPRFGTLVLERIVPMAVRGTATYDLTPETVTYRLQAPRDQLAL